MTTLADRLAKARESAGYAKAVDAIEAFGFTESTYYQHENGTRPPSKASLERYAKAYRVALDWLWRGTGEMRGGISDPETAEIVSILKNAQPDLKREVRDFARWKTQQAKAEKS